MPIGNHYQVAAKKSHVFKLRRPDTSVHRFVLALRRARAQSAAADGARARNRLKN